MRVSHTELQERLTDWILETEPVNTLTYVLASESRRRTLEAQAMTKLHANSNPLQRDLARLCGVL